MQSKKKLLLPIIALLILTASITLGYFLLKDDSHDEITDQNQESVTEAKAQIIVNPDNEESQNYEISFGEEESVFDALVKLNEQDDFSFEYVEYDFGAYIKSMNGITPDDTHFWKFQINSEDSAVGISDYILQDGDEISFVLDAIQF